jgi:TRAP transporter TAXI family solute receptor
MYRPLSTLCLAASVAASTVGFSQTAFSDEIRWGTSRVGSTGHRAVVALTQFLSKRMDKHNFTVQPTPGAILTVKGHAAGDLEGYYGSDIAFYELANDIERFKGFKSRIKNEIVQSMWTFTIEMGVGIHARDRDKIKSWKDLAGKRFFTGPRPWDTRAHLERALKALGIDREYMEVSVKTAGSLLESGRFDAFGVYTNAEVTTAPWITEASLQTDWAALGLSEDEQAKLKAAGFAVKEIPTAAFGKKKTYAEKVTLLPFYYGLHLGLGVSEDDVYQILKLVEADAAELAQSDKAFKQIADDMVGMQVRGITSAVDFVRIHPGLAKYMKEKGAWNSEWDGRIANDG